MDIRIISDLHLDASFIAPDFLGADVVVVAGDLSEHPAAIHRWFALTPKDIPVVYVLGNHEYYGHDITKHAQALKSLLAEFSHVHLLDNEVWVYQDVRFVGTTLWTAFDAFALEPVAHAKHHARHGVNDFATILQGKRYFQPEDAEALYAQNQQFLERALSTPFEGETVVVSHFLPHPYSVSPRYAHHPLNPYFCTDQSRWMPQVSLWLHGHTHESADYQVGNCRVVCNPRGYTYRNAPHRSENIHWDPLCTIDTQTLGPKGSAFSI